MWGMPGPHLPGSQKRKGPGSFVLELFCNSMSLLLVSRDRFLLGNTLGAVSLEEGRAQGRRHACLKVHTRQSWFASLPFGFSLHRTTGLEVVPYEGLMKNPGMETSAVHITPPAGAAEK